MKKTEVAKSDANKRMGTVRAPNAVGFGNGQALTLDRREQRKRDQAPALLPFAVKLNGALVQQLQTLATERRLDLNQVVAELLAKGLAA